MSSSGDVSDVFSDCDIPLDVDSSRAAAATATAGEREGREAGHAQALQGGFDQGFADGAGNTIKGAYTNGAMAAIMLLAERCEYTPSEALQKAHKQRNAQFMVIKGENGKDEKESDKSDPVSDDAAAALVSSALSSIGASPLSGSADLLARHERTRFHPEYATHQFTYSDSGDLMCEDVSVASIVAQYGTPAYIYSFHTIRDNYHRLTAALGQHIQESRIRVCYSVKSNSNLSLLKSLSSMGSSFDVVSGGELGRLLAAGLSVSTSVFAGVGKSEQEIELALKHNIYAFHIESDAELLRIQQVARRVNIRAPIALRVNPDVNALTHAKINTGHKASKFGVPYEEALALYEKAGTMKEIIVRGIQIHIGSQLRSLGPFVEAVSKMLPMVRAIHERFPTSMEYFSIGGGLGVEYEHALESGAAAWWEQQTKEGHAPLTVKQYGEALGPLLAPLGLKVLVEPGRSLVANSGILVTSCEYVKRTSGRCFAIVDCAMNDLMRTALYEARHQIVPVHKTAKTETAAASGGSAEAVEVVGPVCENTDSFGEYQLAIATDDPRPLFALMSVGAYGMSMSNNYNSRNRPVELLVHHSRVYCIRQRESLTQQIACEMDALSQTIE